MVEFQISLPGEGVGDLNRRIRRLDKKLTKLQALNDYLISVSEGTPDVSVLTKCDTSHAPRTLEADKQFVQAWTQIVNVPPKPNIGLPDFIDAFTAPVLPSEKKEDPHELINTLEQLVGEFIYENNRLILDLSLASDLGLPKYGHVTQLILKCVR
jgi:hypothetical protein